MRRHGVAATAGRGVLFGGGYDITLKYSSEQEFLDNIAEDLDLTELELRFSEVDGVRTWDVYGTCAEDADAAVVVQL